MDDEFDGCWSFNGCCCWAVVRWKKRDKKKMEEREKQIPGSGCHAFAKFYFC